MISTQPPKTCETSPVTPPADVRSDWFSVIRALQAAVRKSMNNGVANVSISITVDSNGNPMFWTEPEVVKIHPRSREQDLITAVAKLGKHKQGQ